MNTYLRTLAHGSGELFYLPQNACLSKLPFRVLLPCARDRGVSDVHAPALEENLASTHGNASRMRARTTKKNIVMHAQHYFNFSSVNDEAVMPSRRLAGGEE